MSARDPQHSAFADPPRRSTLARVFGGAARALIALAVIAGGVMAAVALVRTGPKAKQRKPPRQAQLVDVEAVRPSAERIVVHAMGTVGPAQVVDLQPRVSGRVVDLDKQCVPGGVFRKDDKLVKIDSEDYTLAIEQQEAAIKQLAAQVEQRKSEALQRASDIELNQSKIEQQESEIASRESALAQAQNALEIEQGKQSVAKREYELLGEDVRAEDRGLILREPQLRSAKAACDAARSAKKAAEAAKRAAEATKKASVAFKEAAEAAARAAAASKAAADVALRKAQLDLRRTTIGAPFNAIVESRAVDEGSQVSPTTKLMRLLGTDACWVEVSVPVDRLQWIQIPRSADDVGSTVRVYNEAAWGKDKLGKDRLRTGRALRLLSTLEEEGRMARLLVVVPDPLGLEDRSGETPRLLMGSYVRVEIDGRELGSVFALARDRVHDDQHVWLMSAESALDVREVDIVYRGRDRVFVQGGLKAGDRIITSDLAAPVDGMEVRTRDQKPKGSGGKPDGGPPAKGTKGARK